MTLAPRTPSERERDMRRQLRSSKVLLDRLPVLKAATVAVVARTRTLIDAQNRR